MIHHHGACAGELAFTILKAQMFYESRNVQTPNSIDKTLQHGIPSTQCLISDGKMQSPLLGKKTEHSLMSAWPVVL